MYGITYYSIVILMIIVRCIGEYQHMVLYMAE